MRNSNSKDKYSSSAYSQTQANKLMKTQGPPKLPPKQQKQTLNSTQYKTPTISNKRIESSKNLQPTKPLPIQQRNFDIEKNMTESKIFQAKQSLQLLKKKMNRTGMSRQKTSTTNINSSHSINTQKNNKNLVEPPALKKTSSINSSKNVENYEPQTQYEEKIPSSINKNKKQPVLNKNIPKKQPQKTTIVKKIEPSQQTYYNQHEQVPVNKNQDFFALLQKQMQKQANKDNNYSKKTNAVINNEYDEDVQLIQCSKGCGRQFNPNAIVKHQKICQKVFQSKRKTFDIAAQRALQTEGYNKPSSISYKHIPSKKQTQTKANKVPKWKLQSAQLRAGLKAINNVPLTKQEKQLTNMQKDSLVPCNYCGRKFNQQAAQKHIPFCQTKAKQTSINSRASNTRKK